MQQVLSRAEFMSMVRRDLADKKYREIYEQKEKERIASDYEVFRTERIRKLRRAKY